MSRPHEMPALSVAIPTFRGRACVGEAIRSLRAQDAGLLERSEIIVVDDASDDRTADVATEAGRELPNFRVERNPTRLGITPNWNHCIRLSRAPFLLILHQDDALLPGGLERLYGTIRDAERMGMAFGNARLRGHGPAMSALWPGWARDHVFAGGEYARFFCRHGNFVTCSGTIYRREALEKAGRFDERLRMLEDVELWLRLALDGWDTGFVAHPVASMRFHAESEAPRAVREGATVRDAEIVLQTHAAALERMGPGGDSLRDPLHDLMRHLSFQFLGWGKMMSLRGDAAAARRQWAAAADLARRSGRARATERLARLFFLAPWVVPSVNALQKGAAATGLHRAIFARIGGTDLPDPTRGPGSPFP